jgi:hypothetical protein
MTTIAPYQMMILSAARSISRDVSGRYPIMVDQTNQSSMAIYTTLAPMVVRFEKKSCTTADDDPLRCEINFL